MFWSLLLSVCMLESMYVHYKLLIHTKSTIKKDNILKNEQQQQSPSLQNWNSQFDRTWPHVCSFVEQPHDLYEHSNLCILSIWICVCVCKNDIYQIPYIITLQTKITVYLFCKHIPLIDNIFLHICVNKCVCVCVLVIIWLSVKIWIINTLLKK